MPAPHESTDTTVARHDERLKNIEQSLGELADSYRELAQNNQRISLVEQDTGLLRKDHDKLRDDFEAHLRAHNNVAGRALFELLKFFVAGAMGAWLGNGVHL